MTITVRIEVHKMLASHLLCTVPQLQFTHVLVRSCGQEKFEGETKLAVDKFEEIQAAFNFITNL